MYGWKKFSTFHLPSKVFLQIKHWNWRLGFKNYCFIRFSDLNSFPIEKKTVSDGLNYFIFLATKEQWSLIDIFIKLLRFILNDFLSLIPINALNVFFLYYLHFSVKWTYRNARNIMKFSGIERSNEPGSSTVTSCIFAQTS